jgi:hypothetical protein
MFDLNHRGVLRFSEKAAGTIRMVNAIEGRAGAGRPNEALPARGRSRALRAVTAALVVCLAVAPISGGAFAQNSKKKGGGEEAAQKDNGAAAQRAYAGGTRAFEAGDMAGAEQQLSVALSSGGLPNAQMARALYLRGSASRKLGKPAQAISDLTTAIWLKGGLSDADKTKATEERQLAYKEAGLGDTPPPIGAAPMDQSPKTPGVTPTAGAQVVEVKPQGFFSGISMPSMPSMASLTGGSSEPAAPAAAAAQPADAGQQSSFWSFMSPSSSPAAPASGDTAELSVTQGGAAQAMTGDSATHTAWDTQTAAAANASGAQQLSTGYAASPVSTGIAPMGVQQDASASAPEVSNPLAGTGTAVSNFFGNMFGSSEAASTTTGATQTGSAWGSDTTVVTAQTSSMVQRGPDSPPSSHSSAEPLPWGGAAQPAQPSAASAPVRTASTGSSGRYKLQVAAVRSREEAERLAQSLSGYQPVANGTVTPEIDEAVIGSMGTFYRVRLGPYANEKEPGQLCKTLKPQGFDCMVVTQ